MAQHRCSQQDAFRILQEAGQGPDTTLAEVAADIIAGIQDPTDIPDST